MNTIYGICVKILSAVTSGFSSMIQRLIGVKSELDEIKNEQAQQRSLLEKLLAAVTPGPTASAVVTFYKDGQPIEGRNMVLKDNEQVTFTISPTDAKGQPSNIDPAKTVVTADRPDVAIITLNPDGLSGTVKAGAIGAAQLTGSVTDLNNPNDTIQLTIDAIQVVPGDTANVVVNFSQPTPQDAGSGGGGGQA